MIPRIINEFYSKTSFASSDEVRLFRNLALAITKHSKSFFIDETHGGNVCNVAFTSVLGIPETCEIADLLILSHAPSGMLRATFWQAKKSKQSKWLSANTRNAQLDFIGQFNQWDLLCRRPQITGITAKFMPPSDLLSRFSSSAIGSFGVFYQHNAILEVCHSTAEFISCNAPLLKHPRMVINGYLEKYVCISSEIITRFTLKTFLEALFAHNVGALLNPTDSAHRWLAQYVRSKASNASVPTNMFDTFLRGVPTLEDALTPEEDGLSVLIVETNDKA